MLASELLARYQEKEPIPLMAWGLLNHAVSPDFVNDLFARTACNQYTRTLLFSDVVALMSTVVTGMHRSVGSALEGKMPRGGVSDQAVYGKLNGLEPVLCEALVRESSQRLSRVIAALGNAPAPPVPGYRTRILDGNAIGATEHRLDDLRDVSSAALPGKSLVFLDAQESLATEMIACEDGHAQERSMSDEVLKRICVNDLVIADRNFCTTKLLVGIHECGGAFLIREHKNLPWTALEAPIARGVNENGAFWEHTVRIETENGASITVRRIIVELPDKTRDGDSKLVLLTTLPPEAADAMRVAELYRTRWTIETLFQTLTTTLRCEAKTLCYPRAALFVFAVALLAANVVAALRAVIGSVHGRQAEAMLSTFYIVAAIQRGATTLFDGFGAEIVAPYANMTLSELVDFLQTCARHVDLERYRKAPPKPKRPRQKKRPPAPPDQPHVSTARILAAAKEKKKKPKP
jgi:IS4 transposase